MTVDEFSFDDLERFAAHHPRPAPPVKAAIHVNSREHPRSVTKRPRPNRKGRFYRPELFTSWERFSSSTAIRIGGFSVLLIGTTALVMVALTRFP